MCPLAVEGRSGGLPWGRSCRVSYAGSSREVEARGAFRVPVPPLHLAGAGRDRRRSLEQYQAGRKAARGNGSVHPTRCSVLEPRGPFGRRASICWPSAVSFRVGCSALSADAGHAVAAWWRNKPTSSVPPAPVWSGSRGAPCSESVKEHGTELNAHSHYQPFRTICMQIHWPSKPAPAAGRR